MTPKRARSGIAAAVLIAALPGLAGATELYLRTDLGFDAFDDADDQVITTELADPGSAVALGTGGSTVAFHLEQNNFFPADASAIGGGYVSYGSIKGVVGGVSTSRGVGVLASSVFKGRYVDSVTMTPVDPALNGTQGTMISTVLVHVDVPVLSTIGTTDFAGDIESQVSLQWILQGAGGGGDSTTYALASGTWQDNDQSDATCGYDIQDLGTGLGGVCSVSGVNAVLVPVQIDFVWGTAFDTGLELQATALVDGSSFGGPDAAFASGTLDFLNTVTWQGIQSVRDSQGNLVTGWTASSLSGTDYSTAVVPAPGAFLLFATALAGLATRIRKR